MWKSVVVSCGTGGYEVKMVGIGRYVYETCEQYIVMLRILDSLGVLLVVFTKFSILISTPCFGHRVSHPLKHYLFWAPSLASL